MKDTYIVPELEVIELQSSDVIVTSPGDNTDEGIDFESFSLDPNESLSFY